MKFLIKIIFLLGVLGIILLIFEPESQKNARDFLIHRDKTTPLTNEDIAGVYKVEQEANISKGIVNQGVILDLKENGTYSAKIFISGEETSLSPQNGTYSIDFEEDIVINKDSYGEVTGKTITYIHTLTCNWQSKWGLRVSKYYISNNKKNQLRLCKSDLVGYTAFTSFISNDIDDCLVREEINLNFTNNEKKQIIKEEETVLEETVLEETVLEETLLEEADTNEDEIVFRSTHTVEDPDGWTNFRETPKGKIINKLYNKTKCKFLENNNGWFYVELEDGKKGYVHNSRLKTID